MIKEYTIKSKDKKSKESYSVCLCLDELDVIVPEKSSCTCKHGSFYRFTQVNIAAGNWQCSHIKEAIKKLKNGEPDNIEIEKEENDGKTNRKPLYPIF